MFYRKMYERMKAWKSAGGRTALFLTGARGVGKTTLAKAFAGREYAKQIFIDFSEASPEVLRLFDGPPDPDGLVLQLQLCFRTSFVPGKNAVVFDSVQYCASAREAAEILAADGRLSCIMTGSPDSLAET